MTTPRISTTTSERINQVLSLLSESPWKTRAEIGDALGLDLDTTRKLFPYLNLRQRPRNPGKKRPVEYALPKAPPRR